MLSKFQNHIVSKFPFLKQKKLFLAVSGGLDSMVLLHLFKQLNYEITVLHCNFQLRGLESFGDQEFIQNYCDKNNIKIFTTQFDTQAFAEDYKLSIQVAARELRYSWFYELLEEKHFDYLLTAHHADDNLETFIINLTRGTGLDGLTGIPEQNDKIIRPLLPFSREEILKYAQENNIEWREDSSNASTKYVRNKIRHDLVPVLKQINPNFLDAFQKTQSFLQESKEMVEDASIVIYQQVAKEAGDDIHFDLNQLKKLPNYKSYLYQWLNEFGFSAWKDIYDLVEGQSGKQVFSDEFRLLKNREILILTPISETSEKEEFEIYENDTEVNFPLKMTLCNVGHTTFGSNRTIFVDAEKIQFPLKLRKWNEGDVFQPFGMNGKSKKVSKLFKDEKMSLIEKEKTWILSSDDQIVWIVGIRQDERFKINNTTNKILKIELQ
ncbi:tRNA lysidine(34) synthetase TilS [Flavobacterium johnsoniae]|uniref:tRNA(Ile)-lysidine synthase n=3 Tax=Flavobacterium johnsoniae TaxID=986 RepID=A5FHZ6_FLAJ1|nr:tRNA lysidine(34) synthetase TilS [Flavobacterium johnsoniae]ABQ05166.1 tRNA(Ile)-lysidine synthetase [Flavobacterium johnsoniae UW101]OXG00215.1 tRNA lysidine(34) synthetase TilS [Flavobacterium johnsoniae UW101]WQG83031.1 tRNA lysidine(34) synthetase TilS [Flavobacterium johnsoniae UW101]SHL65304.1 tRNA(Ile)-lysidine synthase [Flavobacterium johnsoniae]